MTVIDELIRIYTVSLTMHSDDEIRLSLKKEMDSIYYYQMYNYISKIQSYCEYKKGRKLRVLTKLYDKFISKVESLDHNQVAEEVKTIN